MLSSDHFTLPFLPNEQYPDNYFPQSTTVNRFLQSAAAADVTFPMSINNMTIHDYLINTSSSLSSTSDEADEQQMRIIDERKQRRMISNRESARRSRMRKQKHLDELWSQVVRLRNENHSLLDKLNHVSESHDRVLEENARLKEEATGLRKLLAADPAGLESTRILASPLEFDDVVLRAESSSDDSSL
ncbi:Basic leucine zipper 43 [Linum perenne]